MGDNKGKSRIWGAVGALILVWPLAGCQQAFGSEIETTPQRELAFSGGIYELEKRITFNVLDLVALDPETGQITLVGHRDPNYEGPSIPYLQHLAVLLEYPDPQFSLNWTPESEARVDALFSRLDSVDEQDRVIAEWSRWLDDDGSVTPQGRVLLPLFGVAPTDNGQPPGRLGARVELGADGTLRVVQVASGSPAEGAGLQIGDEVYLANGRQPIHPTEFDRMMLFAGAGAHVELEVSRGGVGMVTVTATLAEAGGDPWAHLTRQDIVERMLMAGGREDAARVVASMARLQRLINTPAVQPALIDLIVATGNFETWQSLMEQAQRGEITEAEFMHGLMRSIIVGMDAAFELSNRPLTGVFDRTIQQGYGPESAMDEAFAEANRQLKSLMLAMMPEMLSLLRQREEVVMPPSIVEATLGAIPEVTPEYIGLDPRSQLARVMFESDYLGKSLIYHPDLADRIPGYQTEFSFNRSHPDRDTDFGRTTTMRLWISIDSLDLAQSPDGYTLETRGAKMRFNIREIGPGGQDLPPVPGSYEELLTSLYDDLAREFPILHELRETAKLAAAAQWLKGLQPDIRLPEAGRTDWAGPSRAPGVIYMVWATQSRPDVANVVMVAMGGVSLKLPPVGPTGTINDAIPRDPAVPDVRDLEREELAVTVPATKPTVSDSAKAVLACIQKKAQQRAKQGAGSVAGSDFLNALKAHFLNDYLAAPGRDNGLKAIEKLGEAQFLPLPLPRLPSPLPDIYKYVPKLYVPKGLRDRYPGDYGDWEWLYPATQFWIIETPLGNFEGKYIDLIPYIDVPFLVGSKNPSTDRDADVKGGGKNLSNVMHWATGMKYWYLPEDAMRELFIGYELWHLEGWDVFGEDAINDLIAEEAGRKFGVRLARDDPKITSEDELVQKLDQDFRETRAWVGAMLRLRQKKFDELILAPEPPKAQFWWGQGGREPGVYPPWADASGAKKTIRKMLEAGMTVDEVCKTALVKSLTQIYTLIYEATEYGPVGLTDVMKNVVLGEDDDQFKAAGKWPGARWEWNP